MRKILFCGAVCMFLACMPAASRSSPKHSQPCSVKSGPSGWRIYVDRLHGFCFSYPSTYAVVAKPWLEKYTNNKIALEYFREAAKQGRLLRLQNRQETSAFIIVFLEDEPFDLQRFVRGAPTGIETPPEPRQVGTQTFYYYGPGGGGVAYADQYFFNLKGKTLSIVFDGPVARD
jgi:hypothetical protein